MVKHTFKMLQLFASRFFKVCLTIYTFHVKNMEFRRVFGTLWKRRNVFARIVLAGNYMFQVNNRNIRTRCEICSKLTIKTPERPQWRRSSVFIVNFEQVLTGIFIFLIGLPCFQEGYINVLYGRNGQSFYM